MEEENINEAIFTESEFAFIADILRGAGHILMTMDDEANETIVEFINALENNSDIKSELDEPMPIVEEQSFFDLLRNRRDK